MRIGRVLEAALEITMTTIWLALLLLPAGAAGADYIAYIAGSGIQNVTGIYGYRFDSKSGTSVGAALATICRCGSGSAAIQESMPA